MPYFNHEKLIVYQQAIDFAKLSVELDQKVDGKAAARDHLFRASCSIPVNIAAGNSKQSDEGRAHLFEIACGSAMECAACLDVLAAKGYLSETEIVPGKELLRSVVSILLSLRSGNSSSRVEEEEGRYGRHFFAHESLEVYQCALRCVSICQQLSSENEGKSELKDSLDRSSTSVVLNLAEGNAKFSHKDQSRFLDIAHTSALKCASTLDVWVAGGQVSDGQIAPAKSLLAEVVSMVFGLMRRVRKDGEGASDCEQGEDCAHSSSSS